ncbi:MAG: ATP-binding protein [Microbacteriaceae bacterium]
MRARDAVATEDEEFARLQDARDRRVLLLGLALVMAAYGLGAALQTSIIFSGIPASARAIWGEGANFGTRLLANGSAVAVAVVLATLLALHRRRGGRLVLVAAVIAVVAAVVRMGVQLLLVIYEEFSVDTSVADTFVGVAVTIVGITIGTIVMRAQRRARVEERGALLQSLRASEALDALQSEELRVRREVAEGLHGTVQQQLVLVRIRLDSIIARLRRADAETQAEHGVQHPDSEQLIGELDALVGVVEVLRERGVRELSQLLYPAGTDLGLAQAARMMLRSLPPSIATRVDIGDAVLEADDPSGPGLGIEKRILLLRVLEEAVSNALRHGRASTLALRIAVEQGELRLALDDDGTGLPEGEPSLHGLALLRTRLIAIGASIELGGSPLGGARVLATLPL